MCDRSPSGLATTLVLLLAVPLPAWQPAKLQILVIGGEGAINNIKQRTAREPVVEVRDENNKPVAGAIVVFTVPDRGASGTFAGGSNMTTVPTDAQGRAIGRGFRPNNVEGSFEMRVTASSQGATASGVIRMQNISGAVPGAPTGGGGKLIGIIAAVSGAVAFGTVYALRQGSDSGPPVGPAATTIAVGAGSVGPRP